MTRGIWTRVARRSRRARLAMPRGPAVVGVVLVHALALCICYLVYARAAEDHAQDTVALLRDDVENGRHALITEISDIIGDARFLATLTAIGRLADPADFGSLEAPRRKARQTASRHRATPRRQS